MVYAWGPPSLWPCLPIFLHADNGTMDGTQWSLEVAFADHTLKTHGDNNYPEASGKPNGKPERTKAFERYLDAVRKLIGGKAFE
jgi:hypothetical protein